MNSGRKFSALSVMAMIAQEAMYSEQNYEFSEQKKRNVARKPGAKEYFFDENGAMSIVETPNYAIRVICSESKNARRIFNNWSKNRKK